MHLLLDVLYAIAAAAYLPILLWRVIVKGKYRSGWGERFGMAPRRGSARPCIWVHAVSLGEVNATRSLISELSRRLPGVDIVLSTTTQTGFDAARREFSGKLAGIIRFPLDFSAVVSRVFGRIRPSMVLLMELEVWPNFVRQAAILRVPVCVVNGRVTEDRSMRRFRLPLVRRVARWMFSRVTWVAAQDETYAARFRELGVPADRVHVVGSVKYDTAQVADSVDGDSALARAMGIDADSPLLVAGSTGPGEEEILLEAWTMLRRERPTLQLAIIPRKPERFDEVARLIQVAGHTCVRRTAQPDGRPVAVVAGASAAVRLGDTMGELRKFYSLADMVFIGRSLAPMGGSDVMEAAGLGKPILIGPHCDNFADACAQLRTAGAIAEVRDAATLAEAARRWLAHTESGRLAGENGRAVVRANMGATARTVALVQDTLNCGNRDAARAVPRH